MKKIISVLLSIMMVVAVGAVSVMPAMASTVTVGSGDSSVTINGAVNGSNSNYVVINQNPDYPGQFTFEYTGNDILVKWEFIGLEQTDYFVSFVEGNKITIELSTTGVRKDFTANAITKKADSGSTDESTTAAPSKPSEGNTDKGGTSPSTGAAMAGVAVAGAGIAVLALRKKND